MIYLSGLEDNLVALVSHYSYDDRKAIKFVRDEEEFTIEKHILEALNGKHHTVKLYWSFSIPIMDCMGFVMEALEFFPVFPLKDDHNSVKYYIRSLLEAVQYIHSLDIVHRDINPNNIGLKLRKQGKLTQLEDVVLCDFGIACDFEQVCYEHNFGTTGYMAPEMVHGSRELSCGVDIFSVGVVFAETLLGMEHFLGDNEKQVSSALDDIEQQGLQQFMTENNYITQLCSNPLAFDLLLQLLEPNASERITAEKALKHSYFVK